MKNIAVLFPDRLPGQVENHLINKLNENIPGANFQAVHPHNEEEDYAACLIIAPHGESSRQAAYMGLFKAKGVPITVVNCWETQDPFLWLRWADNVVNDLPTGIEQVCRSAGIRFPAHKKELFTPTNPNSIVWGAVHPNAPLCVTTRLVVEENWFPVDIYPEDLLPDWSLYRTIRLETLELAIKRAQPCLDVYISALHRKEEQYAILGIEKLLISFASPEEIDFVRRRGGIVFLD